MKTILVSGGLGFIGSHTVIELLNKGFWSECIAQRFDMFCHCKKVCYISMTNH